MSSELISVIIAGYPLCVVLGIWLGYVNGRHDAVTPNGEEHWSFGLMLFMFLAGTAAALVMIVNLIAGFMKGVQA